MDSVTAPEQALDRAGVTAAVVAYSVWGLLPAFWSLLAPAGAAEIVAHRITWTALVMALVLTGLGRWRALRGLRPRTWLVIAAGGVLITANWAGYIVAVETGQVVEAALGYFISPLVSVLLAVVVLHERLRPAQWAALALGATAVTVLAVENGKPPWLGLMLAVTFGVYGLVKKTVPVDATAALTAEGLVLAVPAVVVAVVLTTTGHATLTGHGAGHVLLLVAAGPATALPLLLYGIAARRIPLTAIGLLMYINPVLQFLWGVFIAREDMPPGRWAGFALVWAALAVFTVDMLRRPARIAAAADQPVRSTT